MSILKFLSVFAIVIAFVVISAGVLGTLSVALFRELRLEGGGCFLVGSLELAVIYGIGMAATWRSK